MKSVKVGDHVVLSFNSCQQCPNRQAHVPAYCYQFNTLSLGGADADPAHPMITQNGAKITGGFFGQSCFATFAIAHELNAIVVSRDLPLAKFGRLGCGIQTGAGAALNSLKVGKGTSFAVIGGGAVGLSALMAAKAVDASPILVVEPNPARRSLARELGADATLDPTGIDDLAAAIKDATGGVQCALDTTGIPTVIGALAETLLPNGLLGLVGASPLDAILPVNIMSMLLRGVGIKAILEGDSDPQTFIPELVRMHQTGRFPFDRLIRTFPFTEINVAVAASASGEVIKPVLVFD